MKVEAICWPIMKQVYEKSNEDSSSTDFDDEDQYDELQTNFGCLIKIILVFSILTSQFLVKTKNVLTLDPSSLGIHIVNLYNLSNVLVSICFELESVVVLVDTTSSHIRRHGCVYSIQILTICLTD